MQVSFILSDLTSLRVCDHSAALALVSACSPLSSSKNPSVPVSIEQESVSKEQSSWKDDDPDMQRATDLVELHYGVKMKHAEGMDKELAEARKRVEEVMESLKDTKMGRGQG